MDAASVSEAVRLAREASKHLDGPEAAQWMDRLEENLDQLRAAFTYLAESGRDSEALEFAAALWPFQFDRGHAREGLQWLEQALALPGAKRATIDRAEALHGAGTFTFRALDQAKSERYFDELRTVAGELGNDRFALRAYGGLSRVSLRRGDTDAVRRLSNQALVLARQKGPAGESSTPLHMLAAAARLDGDFDSARRYYNENLALNRGLGRDRWVSVELLNLAALDIMSDRVDTALALLREGFDLLAKIQDHYLLPYALAWTARVKLARGDPSSATELMGAAQGQIEQTGMEMDPDEAPEFKKGLAACRNALSEAQFQRSWQMGERLNFEEASALGRRSL